MSGGHSDVALTRDESLIVSRALKSAEMAFEYGKPVFLPFFDARMADIISRALRRDGAENFCLYGGWEEAERTAVGFFPYGYEEADMKAAFPIKWIIIASDGYAPLTHRDYLGALLAEGIKREVLGDIITSSSLEGMPSGAPEIKSIKNGDYAFAAVFDGNGMAEYIKERITGIGRCKAAAEVCGDGFVMECRRAYERMSVPVTSLRIDCVTAELTGMSRSDAKETIERGLVISDYVPVVQPDKCISAGSVISIRGYGKFKFVDVTGTTRSGRLKADFLKYK